MGFPKERYQALQILRPINTITAGSLKDAAGTSLGIFTIPDGWGGAKVKAMGFHHAAAGGAQTTAGTMKLQKDGSDVVNASSVAFTAASVASHAAWSAVETELNQAASATPSNAPSYPSVTPGQKLELLVATQGVGAGDQTIHPYLLVSQDPSEEDDALNN